MQMQITNNGSCVATENCMKCGFHMIQIVVEIIVKRVFEWIWTFYADADHWQW